MRRIPSRVLLRNDKQYLMDMTYHVNIKGLE